MPARLRPNSSLAPGGSEGDLAALLRQVTEQTAVLRAIQHAIERLESRERPATLSRADHEALTRLLPAVAGALGSELFLVREVLASADAGLRLVTAGTSGRALGRLLMRAKDIPIGGFVVTHEGEELGSHLWRVTRTIP